MVKFCSTELIQGYRCTFYICLILVLHSCGKKNEKAIDIPVAIEADTILRDKVLGSLRSSRITEQLYKNGLPFRKDFLHTVNLTGRYLKRSNKHKAAANLGIYLSDLNYLMGFGQLEEAKRYFESCYRLSEYVGMKKQFSNAVHTGFSDVIESDSTLDTSLKSLFKNAGNTAADEELKKLHITALTGYYIEELYHILALLQAQDSPVDSGLNDILVIAADQSQELNNLIGSFDHVKMTQEGISAYQDLLKLQAQYLALGREHPNKQDLKINDERFTEIFNTITSIRNAIIKP